MTTSSYFPTCLRDLYRISWEGDDESRIASILLENIVFLVIVTTFLTIFGVLFIVVLHFEWKIIGDMHHGFGLEGSIK